MNPDKLPVDIRGMRGAAELRRELHTIESMAEIERLFEAYLAGQPVSV